MEGSSCDNGLVVLMSWLLCSIPEGHVAGAITSLMGFREQRNIVIPTFDRTAAAGSLIRCRHHWMALTVAS